MIAIPAIDLKDGRVVRLLQGNFKEETVYSEEPHAVAKRFEDEGAQRIHIVDLDGALKGKPKNIGCVESIIKHVKAPIEIGGGIRDIKIAKEYFSIGVRWVILGTKACLDKGFLKEAVKEFGDKAIIGIDARDGMVATDGWTRVTEHKAIDLAKEVESAGGKTIIYTDISRDGAMKGPSLKEIKILSSAVKIDVIASGGISCAKDISNLLMLGQKNISGVIIGKALYEKKITVKEAIEACQGKAAHAG
jgi:phosphoribosylformimino-5-aminoimidazole carboxamide ribotide isomerase